MDPLSRTIARALYWCAAFALASSLFFVIQKNLRMFPPTEAVAIGRVTVEKESKTKDYVSALAFYLLVPLVTIGARRWLERGHDRIVERWNEPRKLTSVATFTLPMMLAPAFYLTTRKEGWALILPLALGFGALLSRLAARHSAWLRRALDRTLHPYHALIVAEAHCWILFRYLTTGKRIAHIPTLFLEVIFVAGFAGLLWVTALLIARLVSLTAGVELSVALRVVAIGASPFLLLAPLSITTLRADAVMIVLAIVSILTALTAWRRKTIWSDRAIRSLLAYAVIPAMIFAFSYGSTARQTEWIDLFHRGESLGPASDYLRGKVPYRDVFVLHGLLEDGFFDAIIMKWLGRDAAIASIRTTLLSALMLPLIWYLAWLAFGAFFPSLVVVVLTTAMTLENQRGLVELIPLILLILAIRRSSKPLMVVAGAAAAFALFSSFDIGLYSIAGGLLGLAITWAASRDTRLVVVQASLFVAGVVAGAAPFLIYLAANGAAGAFFTTSFIEIPRFIDAVWSIPFPDFTTPFRHNLTLQAMAQFFLGEGIRFVINPIVIAIASIYLLVRFGKRQATETDVVLGVILAFSLVTQRSAIGRADFQHQPFSAFLIAPLLVAVLLAGWRNLRSRTSGTGERLFAGVVAAVVVPLIALAVWLPDLANARLDNLTRYRSRIWGAGYSDPDAMRVVERIEIAKNSIAARTRPDDPIFDFSNQPALYFYADRPNPTRFYQIPIASPLRYQREIIESLETSKPRLVLRHSPEGYDNFDGISNDLRAPLVAEYLNRKYRFEENARGIELWTRCAECEASPLPLDRRLFRLPREGNLAGTGHFLFPAVGSLEGGAGAQWRSDLIAYNDFREPIAVRLRFRSEKFNADRSITIGVKQAVRFEDVARSLFGVREAIGALWIEYRNDRPPILKLKTYDARLSDRFSMIDPISVGSAAKTGELASGLVIIGATGGPTRRVNIGVISVGDEPASFRISIRNRIGETISPVIEAGVEEEKSYLIVDSERRLRTKLGGEEMIRIEMIRGQAVGYATVVDGATGETEFIAAVPSAGK